MSQEPELRFARPADDIRALWETCFPGSDDSVYWNRGYRPDNTLIYAGEGRVYAMLHILERVLKLEPEHEWPIGYIHGIATHPDMRGRGLAGELVERALSELHLRQIPLAALIPYDDDIIPFYERFGFAALGVAPAFAAAREGRPATDADIPRLRKLYDAAFPCRILRTDADWRVILEEYRVCVTPNGYAVRDGDRLMEALPLPNGAAHGAQPPAMLRVVRADASPAFEGFSPYINLLHN